jgi:type I restriction enzyme S subunit
MNRVNVPQLRFKGFEAEWKNCLLNDITKYVKGFAFKSEDYQENGVRIVRVSDLSADRIKNDNEKVFIDEDKSKVFDKYKLSAGNIVITTVGSKPEMIESAVGRGIYIHNDNEGLLNQNMLKFENIKNVTNGYIIGLINTKRYQHYMKSIARGNANQANITVVDLLQYQVSIPTLPEQQKIASFLSTVDEKIQQLSRKAALLGQYKKGLMQQLFSGKLRFKDENGNDYADWEERKLGDFCTFFSGGTPTSTNQKFYSGTIPFIGSGNIYDSEVFNFISEEALNSSSSKIIEKGDLLYALYGANSGELAISKMNGAINQAILCIRNEECIEYLYYVLLLNKDNIVAKFLQGGQGNLSAQIIKKLRYTFPSITEQQKIADFLSNVDTKIESTNHQITQTQSFKKGLLQQLFV